MIALRSRTSSNYSARVHDGAAHNAYWRAARESRRTSRWRLCRLMPDIVYSHVQLNTGKREAAAFRRPCRVARLRLPWCRIEFSSSTLRFVTHYLPVHLRRRYSGEKRMTQVARSQSQLREWRRIACFARRRRRRLLIWHRGRRSLEIQSVREDVHGVRSSPCGYRGAYNKSSTATSQSGMSSR